MPTCYKCGKHENAMKCICDECISLNYLNYMIMSKTQLEDCIRNTQNEINKLEKLQGSLVEEYVKKCEIRKGEKNDETT